jgi:hypothetical protein
MFGGKYLPKTGKKYILARGEHKKMDIKSIIAEKKLRPLGNKLRLTQTDNNYNVRLFLFANQADAATYFKALSAYALKTPPPFALEILLVRIHTIYPQPFGLVMPYERTDSRPAYGAWYREAILTCNETLRNYQAADHGYENLPRYVKELFDWTILVPAGFDLHSATGQSVLSDSPDNCFPPLNV